MRVLNAVRRVDDAAGLAEDWLLAILHGLVATLVVAAALFRYVLGDPLVWSEEVILLLFGWMIFIGVANAFRQRTHIVVDVVVLVAPGRVGDLLGIVATLVTLLLLATLIWFGGRYALREWDNLSAMIGISAAWAIIPVVVGCVLSVLHILRNLMENGPRGALWFSDITTRD